VTHLSCSGCAALARAILFVHLRAEEHGTSCEQHTEIHRSAFTFILTV
jgi:hypothetical protein